MEILQLKDLSFTYPTNTEPAINKVNLSIEQGEFVVLCGESGCGKSTLLKLIKQEIAPFGKLEGEILYKGEDIRSLAPKDRAKEIGFVMQDVDAQIVTDFVWHELSFGLESLGVKSSSIRRRVAEMSCYFGIESWFYKKCDTLSGGMKQLLNLASVMVMQPKILLLDEPCAQLDPIAAGEFIATLYKLNRELGLTVVLAEHRLEELFSIADKVVLMDSGKVLLSDSSAKAAKFFKENSQHPMAQALPCAAKIYNAFELLGKVPLSVREGRRFIRDNFSNAVDVLLEEKKEKSRRCALEFKDVWFKYKKDSPNVLCGLSLKANFGEHLCILGSNGAGKTTVLGIIAGLLKHYRGKVKINTKAQNDKDSAEFITDVGLLLQNPVSMFTEKSVGEELSLGCELLGYSKEKAEEIIKEVCNELLIDDLLGKHPYDLSGGEQQKAAFAKVLLSKPKILLLDEPTKGIDQNAKQTLAEIISKQKEKGVAVITVTHDVEFAAEYADFCALIFSGEVVSSAEPVEFFAGNSFYTTAANRISSDYYKNAVLCSQVIELCKINGTKGGKI